jgi:hypothetical protein
LKRLKAEAAPTRDRAVADEAVDSGGSPRRLAMPAMRAQDELARFAIGVEPSMRAPGRPWHN